jgi:hypothetical protein
MKIVRDCLGRAVRLTDERAAHILQHQEMAGMEAEIERVLQTPAEVRVARSDDTVQLFYEFYAQTRVDSPNPDVSPTRGLRSPRVSTRDAGAGD